MISAPFLAPFKLDVYVTGTTASYVGYLKDFLLSAPKGSGPELDIQVHKNQDIKTFFLGGGLSKLAAGSVLLVSSYDLEDREIEKEVAVDYAQNRLLNEPRLWVLLNNSQPLIVINTDGGACSLDWPRTTHHILYRTTWSRQWQQEWVASQAFEPPGVNVVSSEK